MTKDQTKIIRLLAKIQNECGKINFNTGEFAIFKAEFNHVEIYLGNHFMLDSYFTASENLKLIKQLESALSYLKEFYKMNRIIVKKGANND